MGSNACWVALTSRSQHPRFLPLGTHERSSVLAWSENTKCIAVLHFICSNQCKGQSFALIDVHMVDIFYYLLCSGYEILFSNSDIRMSCQWRLFESDSTVIFPWFISGAAWYRSAGSMKTFSHCHLFVQSWIFLINSSN